MKSLNYLKLLATLAASSLAVSIAHAATKTWIGTAGNWTTGANWSATGIPAYGDTALFNATVNGSSVPLVTTLTTPVSTNQSVLFQFDTANCAAYTFNSAPTDLFYGFSGAVLVELKSTVVQPQVLNVNFAKGSTATAGSYATFKTSGASVATAAKLTLNGNYVGGLTVAGLSSPVRFEGTLGYGIMNGVISDGPGGGAIHLDRANTSPNQSSTWEFNGNNTFSGGVDFGRSLQTIGLLILGSKSALGTGEIRLVQGSGPNSIAANKDLTGVNALANPVSFDGSGVFNMVGSIAGTALGTPARTVTFAVGNSTATVNDATGIVPPMSIFAVGNIPLHTVITAVNGTTLTLSKPAKVAGTAVATTISNFTTSGTSTLQITGNNSIELSGPISITSSTKTNGLAATATFQIDNTAATIFSGVLRENDGLTLGSNQTFGNIGSIAKTGNGTLTLTANNTYTGNTTVTAGTLIINGTIGASAVGTVTISGNGTLGGKGVINPATSVSGTLRTDATGTAGGKLNFNSTLTLASAAQFDFTGAVFTGVKVNTVDAFTQGGTLTANFLATVYNGSYKLFDFTGTAAGAFTGIAITGTDTATLTDGGSGVWSGTGASSATYTYTVATGVLAISGATAPPSPPAAVTGLTATGGLGQVVLTWNASATATRYTVKQSLTSGGPYTDIATNLPTPGYTSLGLGSDTTYYYVIVAGNNIGDSANSSEASASTTLAAPGTLTSTVGNAVVNLSWIASNGATSYTISRATVNGGPYTAISTGTVTGTTYADTTVTNGTNYYYVVTAVNATETSPNSNQNSAVPLPPYPLNPDVVTTVGGNGKVTISWNAGLDATGYAVARATVSGGPFTNLNNLLPGTTFTYVDNGTLGGITGGLTNGTTYYYRVRSYNVRGYGADTGEVAGTPNLVAPVAPTTLTATAGNANVDLAWTASADTVTYSIKRGTTVGGPYTDLSTGTVTGTTYSDATAVNGTTYYYVVTAVNTIGESPASNEASAIPAVAPAAPTGLTATAGDTLVNLSWTASSGAVTYTIKSATTSGGPYTDVSAGSVTGTTYSNTGLTNGTAYYYVVVAVNTAGASPTSNEATATPVTANAYAAWKALKFTTLELANPAISGNTADPDGDGISNLMEYATGTDPKTANASAPATVVNVSGVLNMSFNRIADAKLTYTVKGTSDLVAGFTTAATYGGTAAGPTLYMDNGFPLATTPRRFLRLEVTLAP